MRYNININNKKAKEWNLNVQQAYLFVFFYELPSWANSITYDNETYYFASKNKAIEEMPLLTDKRDTMYRYYKQLENKGLIKLVKVEGKDYAKLTNKGKEWNWESDTSDKNPNKLGNKSESNSDKNPIYNNTIFNKNTNDNNKSASANKFTKKEFKKVLLDLDCESELIDDWFKVRDKKKAVYSKTSLKAFINECNKNNYPVSSAVQKCAENSWKGFKYEWLNNKNNEKRNSSQSGPQYSDAFKERLLKKLQS